jgi:hypothetical protein
MLQILLAELVILGLVRDWGGAVLNKLRDAGMWITIDLIAKSTDVST